jgi:hypothetical protein
MGMCVGTSAIYGNRNFEPRRCFRHITEIARLPNTVRMRGDDDSRQETDSCSTADSGLGGCWGPEVKKYGGGACSNSRTRAFSRCGVANVPHSVRTSCLARRRRREVNLETTKPQSDRKTRASGSKEADQPEDMDPPRRGRGRPTKASAKKVWRGMLLGRRLDNAPCAMAKHLRDS